MMPYMKRANLAVSKWAILTLVSSVLPCLAEVPIDVAWLPVTDAERSMKAPVVDKDAGVEALFWRVHIRDEVFGEALQRVFYHYVRLKIFDEKGKEKAATIDIPHSERSSIMYVNGRTIKADGTEIELKKDSVYERDLVRAGRSRLRATSFAMPGVEPRAIVEYRWKEIVHDLGSLYLRIQFQREFPIQKVTYFVMPLSGEYTSYRMTLWPFNCTPTPLKRELNDFYSTTLENVPAFREEPMMPGEPNVRPWALAFYSDGKKREPEKYWNDIGKEMYNKFLKPALKSSGEIKQAATGAIEGAGSDEEKVLSVIRYVRKNLRDLYGTKVTEAERAKVLKQMPKQRLRTAEEILKSGVGTADELNMLFASLATAIGLETRPALVADREDVVFDPKLVDQYFLRSIDMAVNIGGQWKLFDVSARLLPAGMLTWREEGMKVLLCDPKNPVFIESPLSPPVASATVRTATLTLLDDGTADGDVDQTFTGHTARERRGEMVSDTEERRKERIKEEITKVFPDAEVSEAKVENADDPENPLKLHYHVKLPNYAQRTGKRLLLQPLYFQRGVAALFTATDRQYAVVFPYGWSEKDVVSIRLPDGFALDNPDNPGSMDFGKPGSYNLLIQIKDGKELVTTRELTFGAGNILMFPKDVYPKLKSVFDEIHTRDGHTISLKAEQ